MALGQKEVSLKIKANTKKFQDEIKKLPGVTDKEAKKMARKFAKQFDKAEQASKKSSAKMARNYKGAFGKMGKASKKFSALLGPALFAGAAAGLAKMANSASEYTDKVMLMSKQTGMTSETLIGMEFAAQAAGSSIDEMKTGLNAFVMKAGQAANIGGASAAVFDRLGVSVKDAGGELRSTEDIFRDTINAISEMDSASEKATTAAELFGAKGAKLAAVFSDGTGSLDEWAQKAREAGIVMDEEALKASADMDRQMAELKMTLRGVTQDMGNDLIPVLIQTAKAIGAVARLAVWTAKSLNALAAAVTLNIEESDEVVEDFHAMGRALNKIAKAAETAGIKINDGSGLMFDSAAMAKSLRAEMNSLSDVNQKLAKGYKLTTAESKRIWQANRRLSFAAKALGLDYAELKKNAIDVRQANLGLNESDLSDLEAELAGLGKSGGGSLRKLGKDGEKAAEALAKLNRSFELEALARVDEPLAKFEKEIDRINAALLSGLEAQLGHDAILAATDALNAARLEKEEEFAAEWQKIRDGVSKSIDEEAKAEAKTEAEKLDAKIQQQEDFNAAAKSLSADLQAYFLEQGIITAEQAQGIAIFEAIINTAVGVTNALKAGAKGIPMAAIIAAKGALEVATIKSQTFHTGGIVGGSGDQAITAQSGEVVLNRAAVGSLGGAGAADSLNRGGSAGGSTVVQMVYKQRVLDQLIVDNLAKGGPLKRALNGAAASGRRGRIGGRL